MLFSYVTIAIRALRRHLGFAAVNVIGLGVGIAVSVLLLLFVRSELAVNHVFPNVEQIYRIDSDWADEERGLPFTTTAMAGETMQQEFPEVDASTRAYGISGTVGTGMDFYRRSTWLVDPSFTDVFEWPLRYGTWNGALSEPRSVMLRSDVARTIFGTADVVGRTVQLQTWRNGEQPYTVTAVWDELSDNSVTGFRSEEFSVIVNETGTWDFTPESGFRTWESIFIIQFVRLADGTDVQALRQKLDGFIDRNAPEALHGELDLVLHAMTDVYLDHDDGAGWDRIWLLSTLAALILLIAGINFTNLATARSLDRIREVGVRKTLGAHRGQLARQFLVEAVLVASIATAFGVLLASIGLPPFTRLVGVEFVLPSAWDAVTVASLFGIAVTVGLLAGAYPAAVLSGFEPVAVLKNRLSLGWSAGTLRKGLVVVQFALAVILLVGVYAVHEQVAFAMDRDLPYDADRILVIDSAPRDFSPEGFRRMQTARQEIEALGSVEAASVSWSVPNVTPGGGSFRAVRRPSWEAGRSVQVDELQRVDAGFDETYDLPLVAGRFFRDDLTQDSTSVILNTVAVQALSLDNPVGATITHETLGDLTVIGVVRGVNSRNVRTGATPAMITPLQPGQWYRTLSVKLKPGASGALDEVQATWNDVLPDAPFDPTVLASRFDAAFTAEQQTRRVVAAGGGLALFIALLGLLGLTGFTVRRRTREIGIRKVLGATASEIVRLLSADIVRLVGLAIIVGAPVGWLLAEQWLQNYALRIDLTPLPILAIGAAALIVALLAVSVHTLRAASLDPARTLSDE